MDSEKIDERHEFSGINGIPTQPNERDSRQCGVLDQYEWVNLIPNLNSRTRKSPVIFFLISNIHFTIQYFICFLYYKTYIYDPVLIFNRILFFPR